MHKHSNMISCKLQSVKNPNNYRSRLPNQQKNRQPTEKPYPIPRDKGTSKFRKSRATERFFFSSASATACCSVARAPLAQRAAKPCRRRRAKSHASRSRLRKTKADGALIPCESPFRVCIYRDFYRGCRRFR